MFDDPKPGERIDASHVALGDVLVGDIVDRIMCGVPMMKLAVTEVTEERVICGSWQFDKKTGGEIDEDMDWTPSSTGSFIAPVKPVKEE
jgi:hypothetical protein